MLRSLLIKLKESVFSVFPITAIVLILACTPVLSLSVTEIVTFVVCSVLLVVGISLFNLGADLAMTPMGTHVGGGLSRSGKVVLLVFVCFLMGIFITVAEPDLSVLAGQVAQVMNGTALIAFVGVGVGLFLALAVIKIVAKVSLTSLLTFFYMVLFALAALTVVLGNESFLALAFDSGGVTTGPITVPFIMAIGVGIAATLGDKNDRGNSFGLIALCSVGPVIAVMLLSLSVRGDVSYVLPDYSIEANLGGNLPLVILHTVKEVAVALLLITAFFLVLQFIVLRLPKSALVSVGIGLLYTFLGLVVFLTAVSVGFMPVGFRIGKQLAEQSPVVMTIFAFLLGLVVVLAEPAIHVLNGQVEQITGGLVSKRSMLIALSVGVGVSLALSVIRIYFHFNILFYLVPGYFISLGLSFFVPKLYSAIAFDSGGVASGPLTSGFILPFAIGVCVTLQGEASVMTDAFGLVAMVAMTPLITIQLLGFRAITAKKIRDKIDMERILSADDEQIIRFL